MSEERREQNWRYWLHENGETSRDAKHWFSTEDMPRDVAADIAKHIWERSAGDEWERIAISIVDPRGQCHIVRLRVEVEPFFFEEREP